MITDYVGERSGQDPVCCLCRKPVEMHHTPRRDTITGDIVHDYCFRIETPDHFQARRRDAIAAKRHVDFGPTRWA